MTSRTFGVLVPVPRAPVQTITPCLELAHALWVLSRSDERHIAATVRPCP
jgi:hypothetical protein